jgi:tetratricopeptide (TPR) repeat protein
MLIFAGLLMLLPGPSTAQSGQQLADFLERTGEILQWAADQVFETESQQARRILEDAERLHRQSLDLADRGRGAAALNASRRSRDASEHAVRLAREARSQEGQLQQRLERLAEYRDQIADRARESGDERALRFVREAETHGLRAHEHYRQGNFDLARRLVESAEDLLARAARLLFEGGGAQRLERELERTRQAIERIAERVGEDDEAARDLIGSARTALARAEDLARQGRPIRALQTLRLARRLAGQAASSAEDGLSAAAVQQQIERWDERHARVRENVENGGSETARQLLDRARHHRDRAVERLDAEELEPALRQIKAAFDLLNEAHEHAR